MVYEVSTKLAKKVRSMRKMYEVGKEQSLPVHEGRRHSEESLRRIGINAMDFDVCGGCAARQPRSPWRRKPMMTMWNVPFSRMPNNTRMGLAAQTVASSKCQEM